MNIVEEVEEGVLPAERTHLKQQLSACLQCLRRWVRSPTTGKNKNKNQLTTEVLANSDFIGEAGAVILKAFA